MSLKIVATPVEMHPSSLYFGDITVVFEDFLEDVDQAIADFLMAIEFGDGLRQIPREG